MLLKRYNLVFMFPRSYHTLSQ